jgi:hypothetical protein
MKRGVGIMTAVACGMLIANLYGCKQESGGPGERAGKQVDRAMDKAGQQVEKAGEAIQDTARGKK